MKELFKRTEVLYLVAHLSITMLVICAYVFLKATGHDDPMLSNLILIIGGYWFGAMGKASLSPSDTLTKKTSVVTETETLKPLPTKEA